MDLVQYKNINKIVDKSEEEYEDEEKYKSEEEYQDEEDIQLQKQLEDIQKEIETLNIKYNDLFHKLRIPKYVKYSINILKYHFRKFTKLDNKLLDNISNNLSLHLTSLPVNTFRREQVKYYNPAWNVYSLDYKWDNNSLSYEYWYLWCRENEAEALIYDNNNQTDGNYIRYLCNNIINNYDVKSLYNLEIKYIPILIAYIDKELDTL